MKKKIFEKKILISLKAWQGADLVICSGGLTMFDAVFLNRIIIVTSQYKHQIKNILRLKKERNSVLFKKLI